MGQWTRHPNTRKLASQFESSILAAKENLMNKAASSSDPDVKAAFARLEQARVALGMLNSIEPERQEDE